MTIHRKFHATGFSLLELLAIIVIIGVMATLLLPRASAARDKAAQKACEHNRTLLNSAVERYTIANGAAPASLNDLNTPDYFPDGVSVCPVSGNAYSLDLATQRVAGHSSGVHP